MNPYQRLAAAIITKAVDDLKEAVSKREKCRKKIEKLRDQCKDYSSEKGQLNKYNGQINELSRFFKGEWCEQLCDGIGLNHGALMDEIKRIAN